MNEKRLSARITRREVIKIGAGAVVGAAAFGHIGASGEEQFGSTIPPFYNMNHDFRELSDLPGGERTMVDFSYAFAPPHRITVGRPDASDRTLLDLQPGSLRMSWSYDNLTLPNYSPLSFRTPPTLWNINFTPRIDSRPMIKSFWSRIDDVLPGLENVYEEDEGSVRFEVLGGMTAALVHIRIINRDSKSHRYVIHCDSGSWGENPAWIDARWNSGDNLVAGWNERADRVLILGLGADRYSLNSDTCLEHKSW